MTKKSYIKLLSGVFLIKPKKLLYLNAGGPISVTPKKTYKSFKTTYKIGGSIDSTIIIVKEDEKGFRWFPVNETYAKNNFDYVEDTKLEGQKNWIHNFVRVNKHMRKDEVIIFLRWFKDFERN